MPKTYSGSGPEGEPFEPQVKENNPEIKEIGGVEYEVVSTVLKNQEKEAAAKKQNVESSQEQKQVVIDFFPSSSTLSICATIL